MELKLCYGSQWWALKRECLQWMVSYIQTNPDYEAFFSSSIAPDESFFQTLFMASPYANTRKDIIVYLRWNSNGSSPEIISKGTAEKLLITDNNYLFARKFDMNVDKDALDVIDSVLR